MSGDSNFFRKAQKSLLQRRAAEDFADIEDKLREHKLLELVTECQIELTDNSASTYVYLVVKKGVEQAAAHRSAALRAEEERYDSSRIYFNLWLLAHNCAGFRNRVQPSAHELVIPTSFIEGHFAHYILIIDRRWTLATLSGVGQQFFERLGVQPVELFLRTDKHIADNYCVRMANADDFVLARMALS